MAQKLNAMDKKLYFSIPSPFIFTQIEVVQTYLYFRVHSLVKSGFSTESCYLESTSQYCELKILTPGVT